MRNPFKKYGHVYQGGIERKEKEIRFEKFVEMLINNICTQSAIPKEVLLKKYNSSESSARKYLLMGWASK